MKIVALVVLSLLLIFLGAQVFSFVKQEYQLSADLSDVQARLTKAQADQTSLQEQVQYLQNSANCNKHV